MAKSQFMNTEFNLWSEAIGLSGRLFDMKKDLVQQHSVDGSACAWNFRSSRIAARVAKLECLRSKARRRVERREAAYKASPLAIETDEWIAEKLKALANG